MSATKWKFTDMARRYARGHLSASAWTDKDIKALADMLGVVRMRAYRDGFNQGYADGFNQGYAAGHEEQMKMRVQDELDKVGQGE
jgi:flagellar biosynthesis/type III secretory pathway protein FliH